jgi:Leucine-rich repeat (LRR) protein
VIKIQIEKRIRFEINSLKKLEEFFIQLKSDKFCENLSDLSIKEIDFRLYFKNFISKFNFINHINTIEILSVKNPEFPDGFFSDYPVLRELYLRFNDIDHFPLSLLQYSNSLRVLEISSNKLKSIPENLNKLYPNLEILILRSNLIENIPIIDNSGWNSLKELHLRGNKIKKLSETLSIFYPNLKILDLAENSLKNLNNDLSKLTRLELIDISSNNFIDFPRELISIKNLKLIYLNNQNINYLQWELYEFPIHFVYHPKLIHGHNILEGESKDFWELIDNYMNEINEEYQQSYDQKQCSIKGYEEFEVKININKLEKECSNNILQDFIAKYRRGNEIVWDGNCNYFWNTVLKLRYERAFEILVEKIKKNLVLDPLDWTHPHFLKWRESIEKLCREFPTETGKNIIEILRITEYNNIKNLKIMI